MTENSEQPAQLPPKLNLRKLAGTEDATRPAIPKPIPAKPEAMPIAFGPAGSPPAAEPMKPPAPAAKTLPIRSVETPQAPAPTPLLKIQTGVQPQTAHIKIPQAPTSRTERTPLIAPQPAGGAPTKPPFQAIAAETAAPSPEAKKKETSKIPLAAAAKPASILAAAPSTEAPKTTIRIKPKSAITPAAPAAAGHAEGITDKRKTSRISLEAALIADGEQDKLLAAKGPKTIRLQRPQPTASALKAPPVPTGGILAPAMPTTPSQAADQEPLEPAAARFEETSQIEPPPAPAREAASDTRRKTIRVKRPTQRPGVTALPTHTIGVTVGAHRQGQQVVRTDAMHPFFPVFAIATLIVMLTVVWMLCAQTFGKNVCLTRYSYYQDPDLPWYGKLPVVQQN
ncbi:MAG: hypothetical protein QME60_09025 [Verrucomicrobiota bacterium]|nr:hypothetical protein [Verrucomicrobiota bacterium]